MAADVGVRLLAGNQQKITVGESPAAREVLFLLIQARSAGVGRVGIAVEVREHRGVDPQSAKHGHPWWLHIGRAGVAELPVEMKWKWLTRTLNPGMAL
jgi:hypothetical protein